MMTNYRIAELSALFFRKTLLHIVSLAALIVCIASEQVTAASTGSDPEICIRTTEILTADGYQYQSRDGIWYTREIGHTNWISLQDNEMAKEALEIQFPCGADSNNPVPAPPENWVGVEADSSDDSAEVLYYNSYSLRAVQFVRELNSMTEQITRYNEQIEQLEALMPQSDMDEIQRIDAELDRLIAAYPDGLPDGTYEYALELQASQERISARINSIIQQYNEMIETKDNYYETVYEPKWDAFERCSCSSKTRY